MRHASGADRHAGLGPAPTRGPDRRGARRGHTEAATAVIDTPGGELHTITAWQRGIATGAPFYGLEVTAYVEGSPGLSATGIWGARVRYAPFDVQSAGQARAMAAVLGRIERGVDRLNHAEGYPDGSDYAGYLIRVARILSISRLHVRASRQRRQDNREPHDLVDGSGLRWWVEQVGTDVAAGNRQDHLQSAGCGSAT